MSVPAPIAGSGDMPSVDPNAPQQPVNSGPPPDWLASILDQYGAGGYQFTPEDLQAIANWAMNEQMQTQVGQLQYQDEFLKLKGQELNLNEQQQAQMEKEFQWRTGEYWNWFKTDAFQYEKDKLGMEKQLSADELTRSANQTLSSRWQADATKAQAQAQQWQAMQAMGIGGQPPQPWQINF